MTRRLLSDCFRQDGKAKRGYLSKGEADAAAARQQRGNRSPRRYVGYLCYCGSWHIGRHAAGRPLAPGTLEDTKRRQLVEAGWRRVNNPDPDRERWVRRVDGRKKRRTLEAAWRYMRGEVEIQQPKETAMSAALPDEPEFDVDPPAAGEEKPAFDDPVAAAAAGDEPDDPDDPDEPDDDDED